MLKGKSDESARALQIYASHTAIEHACAILPRSGNSPEKADAAAKAERNRNVL
jgi:hypothetical protein